MRVTVRLAPVGHYHQARLFEDAAKFVGPVGAQHHLVGHRPLLGDEAAAVAADPASRVVAEAA